MAMRLFLIYLVVELAVIVALASTIGFGWTVLALLGTFVVGLALAGSQVKRHHPPTAVRADRRHGAGRCGRQRARRAGHCAGLRSRVWPAPPSVRCCCYRRPAPPPARCVTAMAARRMPLITAQPRARRGRRLGYDAAGRGDYIDGEVVDVVDVEPRAVERKLRAREEHETPSK